MKQLPDILFKRKRGILTRTVDEDAFLITRRTIEHLNAPAALIWVALRRPRSRRELHVMLKTKYPGVFPQRLSADLKRLIVSLMRRDLIETVPGSPRMTIRTGLSSRTQARRASSRKSA